MISEILILLNLRVNCVAMHSCLFNSILTSSNGAIFCLTEHIMVCKPNGQNICNECRATGILDQMTCSHNLYILGLENVTKIIHVYLKVILFLI